MNARLFQALESRARHLQQVVDQTHAGVRLAVLDNARQGLRNLLDQWDTPTSGGDSLETARHSLEALLHSMETTPGEGSPETAESGAVAGR